MTKIFFNKIRNYKQKKCYIKNLQVIIDSYNNSQYHYIKSWIIKIYNYLKKYFQIHYKNILIKDNSQDYNFNIKYI